MLPGRIKMNLKPFTDKLLMVKETMKPQEVDDLNDRVTLKQTMEIPVEKRGVFIERLKGYPLTQHQTVAPKELEEDEGLYGDSQYLQSLDYFVFANTHIANIKAKPFDPIVVDVFGAEKIKDDELFKETRRKLPKLELKVNLPEEIVVTKYTTKEMNHGFDGVTAINVNLPYEYYKNIPILDNVLFYDSDKKKFLFGIREQKELEAFIEDVAKNGIQEPLILKIKNGAIVSAKNYYKRLLAALYLRLPTIPVILYVNNQSVDEFECVMPSANKEDLPLINDICHPFFYFVEGML